jgi:hypothetical protein
VKSGFRTVAAAVVSVAGTACVSPAPQDTAERCEISSIDDLVRDPVAQSGKFFCGEIYALDHRGEAILLADGSGQVIADNISLLVTNETRDQLSGLSGTRRKFYIRARVEAPPQCFVPSGSGEECIPDKPIYFHIADARLVP